jgi:PAS domain S-box-containing protein
VFLVGTSASFILYVLTYILTTFGIKAENLAKNRTAELSKFKLATDSASDHIIITDVDGKILYANKVVEKLTGYSLNEIIGATPRLWGGLMDQEFYKNFWKVIKIDKKPFIGEIKNLRKGGIEYFALATVSPILNPDGELLEGGLGAGLLDLRRGRAVGWIQDQAPGHAQKQGEN